MSVWDREQKIYRNPSFQWKLLKIDYSHHNSSMIITRNRWRLEAPRQHTSSSPGGKRKFPFFYFPFFLSSFFFFFLWLGVSPHFQIGTPKVIDMHGSRDASCEVQKLLSRQTRYSTSLLYIDTFHEFFVHRQTPSHLSCNQLFTCMLNFYWSNTQKMWWNLIR